MHRTETENLRIGKPVWVEERIAKGKQPNGYIQDIRWRDHEIAVYFHEPEHDCNFRQLKGGDCQVFTFDMFEGNFTEKFGDFWLLYAESTVFVYPEWYKGPSFADL